jgi:hypothetical protein
MQITRDRSPPVNLTPINRARRPERSRRRPPGDRHRGAGGRPRAGLGLGPRTALARVTVIIPFLALFRARINGSTFTQCLGPGT